MQLVQVPHLRRRIQALGLAVKETAFEKFANLKVELKDPVYQQICQLAGQTEIKDPKWGEDHVFDNMLHFVDALESASFSMAPLKNDE